MQCPQMFLWQHYLAWGSVPDVDHGPGRVAWFEASELSEVGVDREVFRVLGLLPPQTSQRKGGYKIE